MPRGKKLKDIDNELTEIQHQARILALITTQRALLEKIEQSNGKNLKQIVREIEDLEDEIKLNATINKKFINDTQKNLKAQNRQYYYENKFKRKSKLVEKEPFHNNFKYEIGKFPIEL
jgi:hypothetical protein